MTFDWVLISQRATDRHLDIELSWDSLAELKAACAAAEDVTPHDRYGFTGDGVGGALVTAKDSVPDTEARLVDRRTGETVATIPRRTS